MITLQGAFESVYDSLMTISVNMPVKEGNVTTVKWTEVLTDVPCRISKKSHVPVSSGNAPSVDYQVSLYCNPSIDVPAGSRIQVTDRHGKTRIYKRSSEAFSSYASHQEIVIVRDDVS